MDKLPTRFDSSVIKDTQSPFVFYPDTLPDIAFTSKAIWAEVFYAWVRRTRFMSLAQVATEIGTTSYGLISERTVSELCEWWGIGGMIAFLPSALSTYSPIFGAFCWSWTSIIPSS